MKFNEQYTIENAIIKFIRELGYEYIPAEEFSKIIDQHLGAAK